VEHLALNRDERNLLYERLSKSIDDSGLTLNEFVFATSDLLKGVFWASLSAGKEEAELQPIRERIGRAVEDVVESLNGNTESVAEDMIVMSTVMLEAVNHIFAQVKKETVPAE
jgi:hypothetical protein